MMLVGFTGLGLGAGSLAFASIPDVAGTMYDCYHRTPLTDAREQAPVLAPATANTSNPPTKEHG
jgi:hypothetical protein